MNSVKISFKKGTTPIATYGFAHDVAYQLILRSDPSYIASANRVLVAAFAAREDAQFIAAIVALDQAGSFVALDGATATADAVRAALFNASLLVEGATGAPASFGLAATNVFSHLGGLAGLVPAAVRHVERDRHGRRRQPARQRVRPADLPRRAPADERVPGQQPGSRVVSRRRAVLRDGRGCRAARQKRSNLGDGRRHDHPAEGNCWLAATQPTVLRGKAAKDQDAD